MHLLILLIFHGNLWSNMPSLLGSVQHLLILLLFRGNLLQLSMFLLVEASQSLLHYCILHIPEGLRDIPDGLSDCLRVLRRRLLILLLIFCDHICWLWLHLCRLWLHLNRLWLLTGRGQWAASC